MNMDYIEIFGKIKETIKIFNQNIEIEFGIEKWDMLIQKTEKEEW